MTENETPIETPEPTTPIPPVETPPTVETPVVETPAPQDQPAHNQDQQLNAILDSLKTKAEETTPQAASAA